MAILVAAAVGAYALAVSLLAPRLLERELKSMLEPEAGISLTIDSVLVNPFTLTVSVTNLSLIGPQNTLQVSIEGFAAGIHPASLLERAWILREVNVIRPRLDLRNTQGGAAEISRLSSAFRRLLARKPSLANARIARLTIHRGELRASLRRDSTGGEASLFVFHDLEFAAEELSGSVADNPWSISATINGDARLDARGQLAAGPDATTIRFGVAVDDASVLEPYLDAGPGFTWSAAAFRSDGTIVWSPDQARVEASLHLRELDISELKDGRSLFGAAAVEGVGIVFDTSSLVPMAVDSLRLERPWLIVEQQAAGELNVPSWLQALWFNAANSPAWIENVDVSGGRLVYVDTRVSLPRELRSDDVVGMITQRGPDGEVARVVSMTGRVAETGTGEFSAEWLPSRPQGPTHAVLNVQQIPLSAVSPFVAEVLGRRIDGGNVDMNLRWSIEDDELVLENELVVRNVQFGTSVANAASANLDLPLAVALLEDGSGVSSLNMPPGRRPATSGFFPGNALRDVIAGYVKELTSTPFETLAMLVDRPGIDLERLAFPAGSATIDDATADKLAALKSTLAQRPGLGLIVHPGYDPVADRKALALQQIVLHVVLATSSGPPGQADEGSIDFSDVKVWTVLDEFSEQRLSASQRATTNNHPSKDAAYYRAVFDALVDNEMVAETALNRLARYRAQTVISELATSGYGINRIRQGEAIDATAAEDAAVVRLGVWPLD